MGRQASPIASIAVGIVVGALISTPVVADGWPTRPVTMVVPFAAGGGFDSEGRLFAQRMSESLGQPVIVENAGGAAGAIGSTRVAKAAPDGYVFLLGSIGTHTFNPILHKKLSYNPTTDFAAVTLISEEPMMLVTRKDFPAGNLQEFIAYVKADGAKLQFGSSGVGSTTHLGCALLNATAGLHVAHVPYRGGGPAMVDLMAGHIDYACINSAGAAPQIANGALKGIAILAPGRSPLLPSLATADEQGLTGFEAITWRAFFVPKGTPGSVVKKLDDATNQTMNDPDFKRRIQKLGVDLVAVERRSPEYLQKFLQSEISKWASAIKSAGISLD
jgi:tripartite-type tricarboxylate transporter receptor subunit TctC